MAEILRTLALHAGAGRDPMSHTRVGWYEECTVHPRPAEPALPINDSPEWRAVDDWETTHFLVGDEGVTTCEANRLGDICAECTERRQEREEDDRVWVSWHGSGTSRDSQGRFAQSTVTR